MSEEQRYEPSSIEKKWQAYWEEKQTFRTPDDPGDKGLYVLDMFPYPSGAGLHVGHPEGYTATDILCRYERAKGTAVLHPMGWDAFGLPAEQHAVKTGTHPAKTTAANIENFRRQLKMLGFSYDWSREVNTTDPGYVRWTQWIFLQLFNKGLAYQDEKTVNWCPALGTVLANEEVIDGKSERGSHPVERRPLRQWVLKITAYADRLLQGLEGVDWPNSTRTMQAEWIGRSEGAEVTFGVEDSEESLVVYTTRPDTLFGATFMVLAPEHPLIVEVTTEDRKAEVEDYVTTAKNKSDLARQQGKEKTGVFTGGYAINPVNGAKVPIWVADYVLWGYGTGAIMAVPSGDERDFEFAKKFDIPIIEVVSADGKPTEGFSAAYSKPGVALNSGQYDGLKTSEVKSKIIADLEAQGKGEGKVQYKLRDWIFSRQRYWGEPFPIYFPVNIAEGKDPRQGEEGVDFEVDYDTAIAVEESALPVLLPELDDYKPGDDPRGVLARAKDWRFFQKDGKWFARETNTMPQWAGSCWYYLRYCDPHNDELAFSPEALKSWLPVDLYVGGAEHAVLHLLYARFWHMVLYDQGIVPEPEPFQKLVHQGLILGEVQYFDPEGVAHAPSDVEKAKGGFVLKAKPEVKLEAKAVKMSKSLGNVVNPDDIVEAYGADSLRVYEMFMGPLEAAKPWSTDSIGGVKRFLDRCWRVAHTVSDEDLSDDLRRLMNKTVDKVSQDIPALRFNTAISAMMVFSTELSKAGSPKEGVAALAKILHPFAPHLGEEMWEMLGNEGSIQHAPWPAVDEAWLIEATLTIPVQVKGKMRGKIEIAPGSSEEVAMAAAKELPKVAEALAAGTLRKTVWVQDKILNLIIT